MNIENFEITSGVNKHQSASIEKNDRMIDYTSSKKLSFLDILSITQGLNVISEFFDVNAVVTVSNTGVCAVALGKSLDEALVEVIDSNPVDYMDANVIVSAEVNSDMAKMLKQTNVVVAPKFTKNIYRKKPESLLWEHSFRHQISGSFKKIHLKSFPRQNRPWNR